MRISIEDLRAYTMVVATGSFSAAANKLYISPPALTRRIQKIEAVVGERLFERTTHTVALTSTGKALIERGKKTLWEFDEFHRYAESMANDSSVRIDFASVWSAATAIVPSLIREFTVLKPNAEFVVHDSDGLDVIRMVREYEVDFGITSSMDFKGELDFHTLCSDPIVLACPPQHALFDEEAVNWAQVAECDPRTIDWGLFHLSAFGELEKQIVRARVPIPIPAETKIQHLSTQIGFLESGLRAAVVPALGASLCLPGTIRMLPITDPPMDRELGIVTRVNGSTSKAVTEFIDFTMKHFTPMYDSKIRNAGISS